MELIAGAPVITPNLIPAPIAGLTERETSALMTAGERPYAYRS